MKINYFWGDLTDISATKEALTVLWLLYVVRNGCLTTNGGEYILLGGQEIVRLESAHVLNPVWHKVTRCGP